MTRPSFAVVNIFTDEIKFFRFDWAAENYANASGEWAREKEYDMKGN